MRILPIKFNRTNFSSTNRTTYYDERSEEKYSSQKYVVPYCDEDDENLKTTKIVQSNRTLFFRNDLPWSSLAWYISKQFKEAEKVNVYNFACSDGSEPYSLAIALIERYGVEGAKKFFPIKASDVDKKIIKEAKGSTIKATSSDFVKIRKMIDPPRTVYDYFYVNESKNPDFPFLLYPREILTENVQFECKSIEDGLDEVEKSNSLILARNFWRYLSAEDIARISMKLRKSIDSSSRVIIGEFDKVGDPISITSGHGSHKNLPPFLKHLGFHSADFDPCNPYENVLKISECRDNIFLQDPDLWLEQVKRDYKSYKIEYGIYQ